MSRRLLAIAITVALAAVVAVAPARGATVNLRVDSAADLDALFDGTITTLPHAVDSGDGSGPHPCSGPSGSAPAATATGALDDAMRAAGIPWRGNWDPSIHDFFVNRIGPYASAAPDRYWSLTINDHFASGGCLAQVSDGDSVHFFYGPLFGDPGPVAPGSAGAPSGPRGGEPVGPGTDGSAAVKLRRLGVRATAYLRRSREAAGADWGRLVLALRRGDAPGRAAAALLGGDLEQSRDGSLRDDVNATALVVLAQEERRPRSARRAARWLTSIQDSAGGFGFRPGAPADVDTTGLAAWALAREGMRVPAQRGADFLDSAQAADGGFPTLPGGASNAQSTGLALLGLRATGAGVRSQSPGGLTGLDFLASMARRNGSIAYSPGANPTPTWTTAQALLGLTGRAKLLERDDRLDQRRRRAGAANTLPGPQRSSMEADFD
ncbi:MAG TPA: hypothetical protein VGO13_09165 [Solirubrobacterales bacterium]|nr:hypothetical protein [Solirubrobacterales bacterium]